MKRFQDKVVIVTGGAMGIGEAIVEAYAREGAKVVIADINEQGHQVANDQNAQGFNVSFIKTDVSKESDVVHLVDETVKKHGSLDVMVANAGIAPFIMNVDHSEEDLSRIMSINVFGMYFCDKYAILQMMKQESRGTIVNMCSVFGLVGRPRSLGYSTSKGAVRSLTHCFALSHSSEGIRVNGICPGIIETKILKETVQSPEHYKMMVDLHPIGRLGKTSEVANAVLFLSSDDASFITGTLLCVDGGYTAI